MAILLEKSNKAYELLKNYNGENTYILYLKNVVFKQQTSTLNNFQIQYILQNYQKKPILLNKIIKIAKWYGELKKTEWNIDFTPEKILIGYLIGETDSFYHAYIKYRKSQDKMLLVFIPKKALLNPLFLKDFNDIKIDFSKYNSNNFTLKPQQEQGVKFLIARKKAILAHQMGGGKTITAIVAALESNYSKILIICPASVKTNWQKEINRFINNDDITIVEGSKWKESRFTIINYDILDNFYTIPTEIVKRKIKNIDDNGKITYNYVDKEIISKKYKIIEDAMANSQLFLSKFDLIIIDEAHKLSNSNSGRYKIILDLIKRSNPEGIFELTGTMITNNPMNLYNILKIIDADITKDWQSYVKTYCDGRQIFVKSQRDKFTSIFLKQKHKNTWYDLTQTEKQELDNYLNQNCKKIWLTNGASNLDELKERIKHLYLRDLNEEIYQNFSKETKILTYSLTKNEEDIYKQVWNEYVNNANDNEKDIDSLIKNKKLIEGSVLRQSTSQLMIPHTIELVNKEIAQGNKVIIFCAFDKEIYELEKYYNDACVVHNGKLSIKEKDKVLEKFNNDDNCKVFLGNLTSSSVGLNLIIANVIVFNSISWLPAENQQAEYRILRIGQTKNCKIYYQKFQNTYMERMFEILDIKNNIIDSVIVDEKNK